MILRTTNTGPHIHITATWIKIPPSRPPCQSILQI